MDKNGKLLKADDYYSKRSSICKNDITYYNPNNYWPDNRELVRWLETGGGEQCVLVQGLSVPQHHAISFWTQLLVSKHLNKSWSNISRMSTKNREYEEYVNKPLHKIQLMNWQFRVQKGFRLSTRKSVGHSDSGNGNGKSARTHQRLCLLQHQGG